MEIERNIRDGLETELFFLVNNLPQNVVFNAEHKFRHPLGIYNLSVSRIWKAFTDIVQTYMDDESNFSSLDIFHQELIESLIAFVDDTYSIFKCCFPVWDVEKNYTFNDRWLEDVNKTEINKYKEKLIPFRSRIAKINNQIKHSHGRYSHLIFTTAIGSATGYFVEGVTDENGTIGPLDHIHQPFLGKRTGTSYSKDIKDLLYNFYAIGQVAAETMVQLINTRHNIVINVKKHMNSENSEIFELVKKISSIGYIYFPDEAMLETAGISISENGFTISKPAMPVEQVKIHIPEVPYNFRAIMSGDGVSKSFGLPYF